MTTMKIIIEIPKGSKHKYEIKDGKLLLDRVIAIPIPHNYGYVPDTMAEDGDPLDVFVFTEDAIHPTATCEVEVLTILKCEDNGVADHKIIACMPGSTMDVSACIDETIQFLNSYKPGFKVLLVGDIEIARQIITDSLVVSV